MKNLKSSLLTSAGSSFDRPPRRHLVSIGAGVVALLGMVAAFALPPKTDEKVQLETVLERLAMPVVALDAESGVFLHEETIQRADTFFSLIARLGISDPDALDFLRSDPATQQISRQLRPGKIVTAKTRDDGQLVAVYFPLSGDETSFVVEKSGDHFVAGEQHLSFEPLTVVKSGEISSSLFGATDAADIPDAIAIQLADIFGSDIDFHRDIRKGDRFRLTYEVLLHHGKPIRSGRVLAAEFVNDNTLYSAYWYETKDGKGGYFTADGKSVHKAFLRSPLAFSRITSGFSAARQHPVLNVMRAHKGIDYGAPKGTPVRAVSDATVDFVGRKGGYGNMIILKHQGAYSTAYGHLNGFVSGIRKGARVSQGETIGFVGQTGLATGPHLHYEFRVNSQQVNPLSIKLPEVATLGTSELARFKTETKGLMSQLALAKEISLALGE